MKLYIRLKDYFLGEINNYLKKDLFHGRFLSHKVSES